MDKVPLVVDIKRDSTEDGPGIRSVVFFKGCPLRCIFCHNPETWEPGLEIVFSLESCVFCGDCERECPENAVSLDSLDRIDRNFCTRCGKCVDVCPGKGLRRVGQYLGVEKLAGLLMEDQVFYANSNGGITLSGGECTLFPGYLEALLKYLEPYDVHIVLETSGYFEYDTFRERLMPYLDLIYFDLKFADPITHKRYTGLQNRIILENFSRLISENGIEVVPRIPLIPGITATRENLRGIAVFLQRLKINKADLLPYNPMGVGKFSTLGKSRPDIPEHFMPLEEEQAYSDFFYRLMGNKQAKMF
jgi:pyruvate formate lyase activating enzyme